MSQGVSVESSVNSSSSQSINLVLHAALSSLDVQLEEELIRYRRQRAGRTVMPPSGLGNQQAQKLVELISLDKASNPIEPPVPEIVSDTPIYNESEENSQASSQAEANPFTPLSWDLKGAPSSQSPSISSDASVADSGQATSPEQVNVLGNIIHPPTPQVEPDDYLASSEQLLRSLAEEETQKPIPTKPTPTKSWLNPLSVGLMLLLLLSSATVGYIIMNPSTLRYLGLNKLSKSPTATVSPNLPNTTTKISGQKTTNPNINQLKVAPILNGPNLASEEFVELNLNTLSTLKPNATSNPRPSVSAAVPKLPTISNTPTIAANPVLPPNSIMPGESSNLASVILPPGLQPVPIPPRTTLVPQYPSNTIPGAAQLNPKPSQSTAQKNVYFVLANYDNDRTLTKVRKIVADAYVRTFPGGNRIQIATFNQDSQAKTLVKQLQKQGIYAWIYHP